jgi:hypothetical protein
LLFENQPAAPGCERWGPVHGAFQVAPNELEDAAEHVRRHRGVRASSSSATSPTPTSFDPDDDLVEFFGYVDASNATSRAE